VLLLALSLSGDVPLPSPVAPTLDAGIEAWKADDHARAIESLEAWKRAEVGPWGRERQAGLFLLGWLYLLEGRDNRASENFTTVRHAKGPLSEFAGWYEALADHRRGRHRVAAIECRDFRKRHPDSRFEDDCLMLEGHAWVAEGKRDAALKAYEQFLDENPDSPREEEARLGMALAHANANPEKGARMLQELSLDHDFHCTGHQAEDAIDDLGVSIDANPDEELLRLLEQRDCGLEKQDAWASFEALAEDPDNTAWARGNYERFGWRTNHYEALGEHYEAAYEARPDANTAWLAFSAYRRGGVFDKSLTWGQRGLKKHRSHARWRRQEDVVAHTAQLAGEYATARSLWDEVAGARTGSLGRAGRWFAAFSAYRMGDYDDALVRLDGVIAHGRENVLAARYYKAKTLDALGRPEEAEVLRAALVEEQPNSWYAMLLRGEGERWGRWPGPVAIDQTVVISRLPQRGTASAGPLGAEMPETTALSGPRWGETGGTVEVPVAPDILFVETTPLPALDEPDWVWGDPVKQQDKADRFAKKHARHCPELPAAMDLAGVGLFELSGEMVADCRQTQHRNISARAEDWRALFLVTHDLHDASRFTYGLEGAEQQAWPPAHGDHVMNWSRQYDVDPLLVLGLMRAESLYRSKALSHAGAVGVMQIMPATGSKVAHLLGEPSYTPAVLEEPPTNIRYGTFYLGALLDRFEGCWPMAVASYNAGPVNVSSWYRSWGQDIALDDWVEQIPYKETRGYVKRVGGYYSTYTGLYADDRVGVPMKGGADDRTVIDF
jgi:tetratricopeptide (TPR) repeat protein